MRRLLLIAISGAICCSVPAFAQGQQITCPGTGTTTITGTVYAPNGTDPLPNVVVYIPSTAVAPFAPGVACLLAGEPASGSPIVSTTSAVNGTFTLSNVP